MTGIIDQREVCITVRADAGPAIGYGHLRRTLAVIDELRALAEVRAYYAMLPGSDAKLAAASGCEVERVPDSGVGHLIEMMRDRGGLLLLDTRSLTTGCLAALDEAGVCTAVFEDGNRLSAYAAGMVVDYAPGAEDLPYRGAADTRFCLGPAYFPLRPEFRKQRTMRRDRATVRHIVVTFGGSDPQDQTGRVLGILAGRTHPWRVSAVLGPGYSGSAEDFAGDERITVWRNVAEMAPVIAQADLAICGAGGTALELAHIGVPALHLVLADDQRPVAAAMEQAGAAVNLGWYADTADEDVWNRLTEVAGDSAGRAAMIRAGMEMVDGQGGRRVAEDILQMWCSNAAHRRGVALHDG